MHTGNNVSIFINPDHLERLLLVFFFSQVIES